MLSSPFLVGQLLLICGCPFSRTVKLDRNVGEPQVKLSVISVMIERKSQWTCIAMILPGRNPVGRFGAALPVNFKRAFMTYPPSKNMKY